MPQDRDDQAQDTQTEDDRTEGDLAIGDAERSPREPAVPAAGPRRPLDAVARAQIGRGLRLHYAAVLRMPIPDRLRTLIDDLAAHSDTEASR